MYYRIMDEIRKSIEIIDEDVKKVEEDIKEIEDECNKIKCNVFKKTLYDIFF